MSSHGLGREAFMRMVADQDGVFSRAQARAMGISDRVMDYRLAQGIWERFLPSVFRMPGHRHSWRQRVIGAYLWGGPASLVSHRSAAIWWGLEGVPDRPVDVTLDTNRRTPVPWVAVHRSRSIGHRDIVSAGPIQITSMRWTILDLASVLKAPALERALDEAVRRDLTSLTELKDLLATSHGGRSGLKVLRSLLGERDPSARITESRLEEEALAVLRRGGLPEPRRQYEVTDKGRVVARIDFAYPDHRIALECDGLAFHFGREAWQRDRRRLNELVLRGWRVLRVTWTDVRDRPDRIVEQMKMLLHSTFRSQQR